MSKYLLILPIALLVTYSQVVVKWRVGLSKTVVASSFSQKLIEFLTDPVILSAYAAALFASFAWLYVIVKLPLSIAFPIYVGITFAMVVIGGWFFLSETINFTKIIAILCIFIGIVLGVSANGE